MNHYKVVLEIEVNAESPLEAAKTLAGWCKTSGDGFIYIVQDDETDQIVSVDLSEEDGEAVLPGHDYKPLIS
ncbi:MAG: hypothetical protein MUO40_07970 [Anaerolineaceae bacterium]|nr:hypothetical protein [Anaerolineaceae bacterium]